MRECMCVWLQLQLTEINVHISSSAAEMKKVFLASTSSGDNKNQFKHVAVEEEWSIHIY